MEENENNVIPLTRQQKRYTKKTEDKSRQSYQKWLQGYPSRMELMQVSNSILELRRDVLLLSETLIKNKVITYEMLMIADKELKEQDVKIQQIRNEPDWDKKFELCDTLGVDRLILINTLKNNPTALDPKLFEELKAKYFPDPVEELYKIVDSSVPESESINEKQ
jgi:hypothetical protein